MQFALCTNNSGYPVALEVGKVYATISDAEAASHGYIRVVDESGEDYAFASDRFYIIELPNAIGQNVLSARSNRQVTTII